MPVLNRVLLRGVMLLAALSTAACAHKPAEDRVTGECTIALVGKCSSKQVSTDLSDAEKATLGPLQNRRVGLPVASALTAAEAALKADGFEQVSVNVAGALVQAEKNRTLATRSAQAVRAVLNAKLPMLRAKPDHETTRALITVHTDGGGTVVHAEFVVTVWDSKGDAKTKVATDPQAYNDFFGKLGGGGRR